MENIYRKTSLITEDLDWYENQLQEVKDDLDSVKLNEIKDRYGYTTNAKGGRYESVISTIEQQKKSRMDTLEKLPKLLNALDELRNKYAEKEFIGRGNVGTKGTAMDFIKKVK